MKFVNLHNHTDRGSYDSIFTADKFINRLIELDQEVLVQTDHGTMRGMINLAQKANKAGLKYIPGLEAYMTLGDVPLRGKDEFGRTQYHIVLLAKNKTGLMNLQRLAALSTTKDHFYYKPRVSLYEILNNNEGLIATSACIAGVIPQTILMEQGYKELPNPCFIKHVMGLNCTPDEMREDLIFDPNLRGYRSTESLIEMFLNGFGDDFYLEIQDSGAGEEQDVINKALIEISKERGIPLIATSDAHYATKGEASLRTMMLKIRTGRIDDANSKFFEEGNLWLKSGEELESIFGSEPIANTVTIANKCNVEIDFKQTYFPVPELPPSYNESSKYFYDLAHQQLKDNPNIPNTEEYINRLDEEITTITELGFADYFLVLVEILKWAKEHSILTGPGRGSAAGSLVSYVLGITNIDPIQYKLFFSRFLNKARVSWPDIDLDIDAEQRDKLIQYVIDKYGEDKVCQIMTFSELKPRGMAKDIGRALKMDDLGYKVSDLIPPSDQGREPTVAFSLEQVSELSEEKYEPIVSRMKLLEGLNRTTGVHAAGLVISPKPLIEIAPIEYQRTKEKETPVIQLSMNEVESIGLVKMDFLGLRNLSVIRKTIDLVPELNSPNDIPNDDLDTYQMLRITKDFGGIFQFEGSPAIGELLRNIQPKRLEDIADATSLFRPGPLGIGLNKLYLANKKEGWVSSGTPMDEITKDSEGCLIYQEQLISMCVDIAGFTPEDGDRIRKVLGKKKIKEVEEWREPFIKGCLSTSGISEEESGDLFESIKSGASYLFNKSHAIAYSLISYWSAYLRTHHTVEFLASLLNASYHTKDKLLSALNTCKNLNIKVSIPTLDNLSRECKPFNNTIILGAMIFKHLGKGATAAVEAASKNPESLMDFFILVNKKDFNSGKAVALAKGGVLDSLAKKEGLNRRSLIEAIPIIYDYFKKNRSKTKQIEKWLIRKQKREEQERLKEEGKPYGKRMVSVGKKPTLPPLPNFKEYKNITDPFTTSMEEYEILGFCLDKYPTYFMDIPEEAITIESLKSKPINKTQYIIAGVVVNFKELITKKKKLRATFQLEDETGILQANIFPSIYAKIRNKIEDRTCISIRCNVINNENETIEVSVIGWTELELLEQFKRNKIIETHSLIELEETLEDIKENKVVTETLTFERIKYEI